MVDVDPLIGRTLAGRYRLISCLGTGGMSAVYLSRHALIDRLSAIKVLKQELAVHPEHRERFLREARAVNRINHPNIVEISDYGEAQMTFGPEKARRDLVYLVMEYVPGETLARLLLKGPLPETRLVPIALQVASALARAHQTGVIHRDVKPENVLLVSRRDWVDLVKLTDFGVAKINHVARTSMPASGVSDQVVGTPGFVAPEYLVGETEIDGRADLYSLGVVMYEALSGALPFDAAGPADLLTMPLTEDPVPLLTRAPMVLPELATVVMRCLRRRPDERPRDAFALIDELRAAAPWTRNLALDGAFSSGPSRHSGSSVVDSRPPAESNEPHTLSRAIDGVLPPKLGDVPPSKLGAHWRLYHSALDRREAGRADDPPRDVREGLARRSSLLAAIDTVTARIVARQEELDVLATRGRDFRATLGRAIDTLAHDLSRAHSLKQELKTKRVDLHLRRRNEPNPALADVLLWEEAAVDDDLRKSTHLTADLGYQIAALQDELFRRNNGHEAEAHRTTGAIEGEMGALSTLHRELEILTGELLAYVQRPG